MKLPAGCRAGTRTVTACNVTAASKATASRKWRKSSILQNIVPDKKSVMASTASPRIMPFNRDAPLIGHCLLHRGAEEMLARPEDGSKPAASPDTGFIGRSSFKHYVGASPYVA